MKRLLPLLFVLALPAVHGQQQMTFENANARIEPGRTILTRTAAGPIEFTQGALLVNADELSYSGTPLRPMDTDLWELRGNVILTSGSMRLIADSVRYNPRLRTFSATNVRAGSAPYYIEGASAHGSETEITIEQARLSFGEPGFWQPTLRAESLVFAPGRGYRALRARAGIGAALALRLPQFELGIDEPIFSALSIELGYRSALGAFADLGLRLPLLRGAMLGGDVGLYSKRGIMAGPSGAYASRSEPDRVNGSFQSGFINDHGDKKTDVLGRQVPENRGFIEWHHRQRFGDHGTIAAELNYWKDSEIVRDFRPGSFFSVQEPDTFIEANLAHGNHVATGFARFQPNKFQSVQERLPEISYDLLPHEIRPNLYEEFHGSVAFLREDPPIGGRELRSNRFDAYYQLRRPIAPSPWFTLTPVVGGRFTHYTGNRGAQRRAVKYTRLLGSVGFDAEVRASGSFPLREEAWRIDGLRHLLTPRIGFRHMPGGSSGRDRIPRIDRTVFDTYLPPLDMAATRNVDDLRAQSTLRVGVDNVFQTRAPDYGSRDLLRFDTAIDFRFRRTAGQREASDIHASVALMPAPWLRFDLYHSFSARTLALRQMTSRLALHDGDKWSLGFNSHFLRNDTEEYAVEGAFRLTEGYETVARLQYDARRRRLLERAIGLRQNLANTWLIEYTVRVFDATRREGRLGFNVHVTPLAF